MTSKAKKIKKSTVHYFVLNGREDLYFKQEVAVNFRPYAKTKHRAHTSIKPTFNNDRRYYTCSFQLPSIILENEDKLKLDHQNRVSQALLEIEDIYEPKPRSKYKYCGVCRAHYEDYKEHVEGTDHLSFLKRSHYQGLIVDLCKKTQQTEFKEILQSKNTECSSEQMSVKIINESSLSISPIKIIQT